MRIGGAAAHLANEMPPEPSAVFAATEAVRQLASGGAGAPEAARRAERTFGETDETVLVEAALLEPSTAFHVPRTGLHGLPRPSTWLPRGFHRAFH